MKLFVLFVVFGLLGTALGDEEGGGIVTQNKDGGESSAITCLNISRSELERSMEHGYLDMAVQCIAIDKTGLEFENLTTIEDFQQQASEYCLEVLDMKNCLVNISKISKTCQNQTQHQKFEIFLGMLESAVEFVCKQDGRSLAVIIYGTRTMSPQENIFGKCLELIEYKKSSVGISDHEASAKILYFYRQLDLAKECFSSRLQEEEEEELRNVIVSFMDEIRSGIKCIHPETHATVLCSTIDNN